MACQEPCIILNAVVNIVINKLMKKYRIEVVWNREFNWLVWKHEDDLELAKKLAVFLASSGDGARVKKIRIVENETDKVIWNG